MSQLRLVLNFEGRDFILNRYGSKFNVMVACDSKGCHGYAPLERIELPRRRKARRQSTEETLAEGIRSIASKLPAQVVCDSCANTRPKE